MIIHGTRNWEMQWARDTYPDDIEYDSNLINTFFLDIEVRSDAGFPDPMTALQEITAITIYSTIDKKFRTWSTAEYSTSKTTVERIKVIADDIVYVRCVDETDLLTRLITFWKSDYPDIISGWYSKLFDIPYIHNRIKRVLGDKTVLQLSPFGIIREKESGDHMSKTTEYDIAGISHLDYQELYKKYSPGNEESYRLGYISELVLGAGETKVEFEGSIDDLWLQHPQLHNDYNIIDVDLVVRMDAKLKMIQLQVELAYNAKTNYQNVFSPVKLWTCLVYNSLIKDGIILPPERHNAKEVAYEGAYVKEPPAGLFDNVVTIDATSLYPSMIITCNISPETMVGMHDVPEELTPYYRKNLTSILNAWEDVSEMTDVLKKYDMTIAANGQLYYKNKIGIIPTLIKQVLDNRSKAKTEMKALKKQYESIDAEIRRRLLTE
jgi:DNA polymerase elongation subunit (family B)